MLIGFISRCSTSALCCSRNIIFIFRFPGRWIGRNPTEWPARSPDLSNLIFLLWEQLENTLDTLEIYMFSTKAESFVTNSSSTDNSRVWKQMGHFFSTCWSKVLINKCNSLFNIFLETTVTSNKQSNLPLNCKCYHS